MENFKIGLFAIGLEAYWPQFDGLKERLQSYLAIVEERLKKSSDEIINAGMVDTVDKAFAAGNMFRQENVSLVFLYVSTYALSANVLPLVQRAGVPVIILNLSPEAGIDCQAFNALKSRTAMTGEWLAYCNACPVPELANVFNRSGIAFHQVTGLLDEKDMVWQEVADWVAAARVKFIMFNNRLGCMGHYYSGMLDTYTDLTLQYATFGGHMEMIEVEELATLRKAVSQKEKEKRLADFDEKFEVEINCNPSYLEAAAITSVALDKLVEKYKLGSLTFYYKGSGNSANEETIASIIPGNSLLTARGIPVAGEYEIKNVQAMKIMDSFGAGGSFTEFYAMDFNDDVVMMGHDGPGHIGIADGKTKIRPLEVYHGKVGAGLSVEMRVKHGPVTLLSVIEKPASGKLGFLVAEGETISGPILEIGNTNSRYKFPVGARAFVNEWSKQGPAHHCAVGVGHISEKIKKLASLLSIEMTQIC